jgi:adenylate kinase
MWQMAFDKPIVANPDEVMVDMHHQVYSVAHYVNKTPTSGVLKKLCGVFCIMWAVCAL